MTLDIMRIKEVIQAGPYPVRPVPHAPPIIEGVITLRGVVIPVIDLRKRFGLADERAAALREPRGRVEGNRQPDCGANCYGPGHRAAIEYSRPSFGLRPHRQRR